jgi:hypothetical protein
MSAKQQFAEVIAAIPESASLEDVFARLYLAFKDEIRQRAGGRAIASPPDLGGELSPDLAEAVASLPLLDDEDLLRAAQSQVPGEAIDGLASLNRKRQAEGLSASEAEQQAALVRQHERTLLIRAEATALLKRRGREVSGLLSAS